MKRFFLLWISVLLGFSGCQMEIPISVIHTDAESLTEMITIKIYFKNGSADDPSNKKGLNNLTASLMSGSRTSDLTHQQIQSVLFPIAGEINFTSEKDVTVFTGSIHKDHLKSFLPIFLSKIFYPVFSQEEMDRSRDYLVRYLSEELPAQNDEELSKIGLEYILFDKHPYQYPPEGRVNDLYNITLDDIVKHHQHMLSPDNVMLGLSGAVSDEDIAVISDILNDVSWNDKFVHANEKVGQSKLPSSIFFIENNSPSVSISLGTPINLTRRDKDFYSLLVANSFLGEHRTFHGLLMNEIRTNRGLNYGDYSYIEHWAEDINEPPYAAPHIVRRQQYFSIWLRTIERENAAFVLKTALSVFNDWVDRGLSEDEFESAKNYLIHYSKLWTQTPERRLAFKMDSEFYGMNDYLTTIDSVLKDLTVENVNTAIKKYLVGRPLYISIVGSNAEELRAVLLSENPTLPIYPTNKIISQELLEADDRISRRIISADSVRVVRSEELFEE